MNSLVETIIVIFILAALPLVYLSSIPIALGDVVQTEHGGTSNCYLCHIKEKEGEPMCKKCHYDIYGEEYNPYVHEVNDDVVYDTCAEGHCHWDLAEALNASVHKSLNCGGCHVPLHISLYEDGVGGWLFVNRLNNSGVVSYKPALPVELKRVVFYFDSTNDTTVLGSSISSWGGQIHWTWVNITGSAASITESTRYLTCFNCHFLTTNPAEAGLMRMIEGRTMIAIPEFTLDLSPHRLTETALRQGSSYTNQFLSLEKEEINIVSGIIAGIIIVGIIIWRKK